MKEEKERAKVLTFPFRFEEMKKYTSFAKFLIEEIPLYQMVSDILDGGKPEAGGFIDVVNVMASNDALTEFIAHACAKLNHTICKMNVHEIFNATSSIVDVSEGYKKGDLEAIKKSANVMSDISDRLIEDGLVVGAEVSTEVTSCVTAISQDELEKVLGKDSEFMEGFDSAIIVIQSGPDHIDVPRKRSEHYAEMLRGLSKAQDELIQELAKRSFKDTLKEG